MNLLSATIGRFLANAASRVSPLKTNPVPHFLLDTGDFILYIEE